MPFFHRQEKKAPPESLRGRGISLAGVLRGATSPGGSAVGMTQVVGIQALGSDRGVVGERTGDGRRDLLDGKDRLTRACLRGGAFVGHDDLLCVHEGRARFRPKTRYSKKPYN